jgi:hypothetical protein
MGCVGSKNQRSEEPAAPAGGSGGFLDGATEPVLLAFIKPGARWEDDFTIGFTTLGVGKWGTVKNWIRETNKYDVQLSPQQVVRIKVENLRV